MNKVFVISPLDKGYKVDSHDANTQENKSSGHNTRKDAVNHCLRDIPRDKQFQIIVMDEDKEV
jgi:hypothetical protein